MKYAGNKNNARIDTLIKDTHTHTHTQKKQTKVIKRKEITLDALAVD